MQKKTDLSPIYKFKTCKTIYKLFEDSSRVCFIKKIMYLFFYIIIEENILLRDRSAFQEINYSCEASSELYIALHFPLEHAIESTREYIQNRICNFEPGDYREQKILINSFTQTVQETTKHSC